METDLIEQAVRGWWGERCHPHRPRQLGGQVMQYSTFRNIKATRKNHKCDGCLKDIPMGQPAFYWAGDSDGEFNWVYYHAECRAAEVAMNGLRDLNCDEWDHLSSVRDDREDQDWLIAEYPVVAERMGIVGE